MELSAEVSMQLERYRKGCEDLSSAVRGFLESPSLVGGEEEQSLANGTRSNDAHLVRARAYLALARGVHAITELLLRGKGCDTSKRGLPAELERIKQHEKKVRR